MDLSISGLMHCNPYRHSSYYLPNTPFFIVILTTFVVEKTHSAKGMPLGIPIVHLDIDSERAC